MTEKPKEYAETALGGAEGDIDALSEALRHAHLRGQGAVVHTPSTPHRVDLAPGAPVVHFALGTRLVVRVDGHPADIVLEPADAVLVRQGVAHSIAAPDADETADGSVRGWVTGGFRVEGDNAVPLLSALPPAIHVAAARPGNAWLRLSLDLLVAELDAARPGSWIMISRILDLVFIHALRTWSDSDRVEPGWLATALDARLAPVLSAIHRAPGHAWSIDEMARLARQSRSAFAHRFTAVVGQSPMAYVAQCRMAEASRLLDATTMPVGEVATAVGFASEAAFSRAFRRRFALPPLAWRRGARAAGEGPAPRM